MISRFQIGHLNFFTKRQVQHQKQIGQRGCGICIPRGIMTHPEKIMSGCSADNNPTLSWSRWPSNASVILCSIQEKKDRTTTQTAKEVLIFHSRSLWKRCCHSTLGIIFKTGFKPKCQMKKDFSRISPVGKWLHVSQEF